MPPRLQNPAPEASQLLIREDPIHTIVENCRRLGINSKYLEDVLTRLPAMKLSEAVTLTPANWLKARSGNRAKKPSEIIADIDAATMTATHLPWQRQ